jgi:hypothetical protein
MLSRFFALLALCAAMLLAVSPATAHKIFPATATVSFDDAGGYRIDIKTNVEALIAGIGETHEDTDASPQASEYNALRALSPDALQDRFKTFSARWLEGVSVAFDGAPVRPTLAGLEAPPIGDLALARISVIRLTGDVPSGARTFGWTYDKVFGSSILRLNHAMR